MALSISFNIRRIDGPYGGGAVFADFLQRHLERKGHHVCRELRPGLDLVLIVSSSSNPTTTAYSLDDIVAYRQMNRNTVVVHRVNMSDEARGANHGLNQAILAHARMADHIVFVSAFIRAHFLGHGLEPDRTHSIVRTGADEMLYHPRGSVAWHSGEPMRFVTHHWSPNPLKGSDIYQRFDEMLGQAAIRERFAFTYIGNLPYGTTLRNSTHIEAVEPARIGDLLRQHHAYLSAARFEAAGNHYIEGMQCGLPILYLNSGSLPEYCEPFGVEFTLSSFESGLATMRERYPELRDRVMRAPYHAGTMAEDYESLMLRLVAERRACRLAEPSNAERLRYQFVMARKRLGRMRRKICRRLCG